MAYRARGIAWGIAVAVLAGLHFAPALPTAVAQSWPTKPLRWIVPYTPGGLTDAVTRQLAPKLQEALGQPIVIENKPGSNSIIGMDALAKAAPDGYTLGTVIAAHAANATLYAGKLPFDARTSFETVTLAGIAPLILTTNLDFPAKDVRELIAYAKTHRGQLSFGSSGIGSAAHLTTELLKQTIGSDMQHVPYKGTAPSLQGLIGGEIQIMVDVPSSLMPQVRAGKIRGLAMFSAKRLPSAGEIPTIVEAGGPAIEASTWVLFLAPAKTPGNIVDRIAVETAKILATPEMRSRFRATGHRTGRQFPDRSRPFSRRRNREVGQGHHHGRRQAGITVGRALSPPIDEFIGRGNEYFSALVGDDDGVVSSRRAFIT